MKIKIKREGGFIGITSKANIEYDDLTVAEKKALDSLLEQSLQTKNQADNSLKNGVATPSEIKSRDIDIHDKESKTRDLASDDSGLELAGQSPASRNYTNGTMRDAFSYSLSMKKDGKTVSLQFDDMTAPPEIVQIFQKYVQY